MASHTPDSVLTPEYARSILRHVASSLMPPALEDLAQEALLKGVEAFRRNQVDYPSAFFTKIVRDTICDHWRRARVWLPLESIDPRKHSLVLHIEERLDLNKRIEQLRKALRRLSPRERQLIHLFYGEGFSLTQLSAMLGKSISAVKMTLFRTRSKIRRAITANCRNRDLARRTKARSQVS